MERLRPQTVDGSGRRVVAVDEARQAARVFAEGELFEDAESGLVAPARAHDLLDVDVPRLHVVELFDLVLFGVHRELTVPVAVAPFGMHVANPAHPERDERLELDALLVAVVPQQAQRRALGTPQARRPVDLVDRAGKMMEAL